MVLDKSRSRPYIINPEGCNHRVKTQNERWSWEYFLLHPCKYHMEPSLVNFTSINGYMWLTHITSLWMEWLTKRRPQHTHTICINTHYVCVCTQVFVKPVVRPAVTGRQEQSNSEQARKAHKNVRNPHIGYYREKEKTLGNVGRGEDEDMERLRERSMGGGAK